MARSTIGPAILLLLVLVAACANTSSELGPHGREYALAGEVRSIKADHSEITIAHGDVKGFMPAMTMPFPIKTPALVDGLAPGDVVEATLVVNDDGAFLSAIRKIGTAPPRSRSGAEVVAAPPLVAAGEAVPAITFTGDDGQSHTLSSYRGSWVLFTFVYTRCPLPDYCPRMDAHFSTIQRAILATLRLRAAVRLLSFSFDPDVDTPARMKIHAAGRGADPTVWCYATAPKNVIDPFGARFGLSVTREGPNGQDITHNLVTALVDPNGRLVKTYTGNGWSPAAVVADLERLVK